MKLLLKSLTVLLGAAALAACGPPGSTNKSKCATLLPGDLVITEFLKDPVGDDKGKEWFEIHNPGAVELELEGIELAISRADGSVEKRHRMRPTLLPSGGYLAAGDAPVAVGGELPAWLGYSYGTTLGLLPNTTGRIAIKCGGTVIDEVIYAEGGKSGESHQLDGKLVPDAQNNDEPKNWCAAKGASYDGGLHFGTPGAPNAVCGGGGTCLDPVTGESRNAVAANPGDLVITEFMPDPAVVPDADGEWFEVYAANRDVDLNGLSVGTADKAMSTVASATCLPVAMGTYALFGHKVEPSANGGVEGVRATFTQALPQAGGTVVLRNGATVIDTATYGASSPGVALQLSPDHLTPAGNDEPTNYCAASTVMANGEKGTPGAANTPCPIALPGGNCRIPGSQETRPIVSPVVGDLVINEFMANPKAVDDAAGEWFEVYVERNVDLNGVQLGTAATGVLKGAECISATAGQYLLFARKSESSLNGGLPAVFRTFSFGLVNANSSLSISLDGTVLDQISWTATVDGGSTQLKPAHRTPTGNDDPANFCTNGTTTYGAGDKGTPGAANVCP